MTFSIICNGAVLMGCCELSFHDFGLPKIREISISLLEFAAFGKMFHRLTTFSLLVFNISAFDIIMFA